MDKVGKIDFSGISTNANSLLPELRGNSVKLKSLIEDTDDTVKKMKLEKLSGDVDVLVDQLQDTVANLQPGLANVDFDALNQTLANARRTLDDMDNVLSQLKKYPSGFIFGRPPPPVKNVQPSTK